jgi:hypothetical protein
MYKLLEWSPDLDLSMFYKTAEKKGLYNNASQNMLIDCFLKEKQWCVWILYYNGDPVGSVAAHSFDDVMGPGSFRIAARTCIFSDMIPINRLRTLNEIVTHQNITSQFFIPACIEWAPKDSKLYITTNETEIGTQKLVHRIFAPAMEKTGQMKKIKETEYRNTEQTVWQLFPDKFYQELNKYPKWKLEK